MRPAHPKEVEDYTTPSLVLIFINMLWVFGVIWAWFGLAPVLLLGWALHHAIRALARRRKAKRAVIRAPKSDG